MALANTTLSGAITANDTKLALTSATNAVVGTLMQVDGEWMLVTDVSLTPTLGVVRGYGNGQTTTNAKAHAILAPVTYGLTSEFAYPSGVNSANTSSISVDGTLTNPLVDATIAINKAGVCAITLTDPTKDQRNTVQFVSLGAYAHTITYATGFYDNTTTSDVATFPATAGAAFTMTAFNGKWRPVATADDGVTIA